MKKRIIILLLCLCTIPLFSFAQNDSDIEVNNDTNVGKSVNGKELGSVGFGFCNEGIDHLSASLNYAVSQGTPFKICAYFKNTSDEELSIDIELIDKTKDNAGYSVCTFNQRTINEYLTPDTLESLKGIKIPANNYIIKEIPVVFPIGVVGNKEYCLTFNISAKSASTSMVQTVVSKYADMTFFVGDLENVKNELTITDIKLAKNDNKDLVLDFNLKNVGNLENTFVISGYITNIFGFKRPFKIDGEGARLQAGNQKPLNINVGSIPSYGGLFKVTINVIASPYFSYSIDSSNIDPKLLEDKVFTITTSYFEMPWLILIIVVLVILFLIVAFRKPKGKNQQVVYVQAPQQPQAPQQ